MRASFLPEIYLSLSLSLSAFHVLFITRSRHAKISICGGQPLPRAAPRRRVHMSQTDAPLAVLGVTSAAGAVGQASAAQYSGRRNNVRRVHDLFATSAASIKLRFLIATPRTAADHLAAVFDEQRRHKDIVFLNITESRFNCAFKYVVWFQHCRQAFSTARFWLVADDDTFIQFGHLASELHTLPAHGHVMWGLVMWYAAPASRYPSFSSPLGSHVESRRQVSLLRQRVHGHSSQLGRLAVLGHGGCSGAQAD
jgi:hypothetical protein